MENTLTNQITKNSKACVICSTQNQMVNYIPIKYFGFNKIYNITIPIDQKEEKNHNKNNTWDRCLKTVLNGTTIIDIPIEQASITNIDSIKDVIIPNIIEKEKGNSIFWNVTGGQRPLLMAINELVKDRKDDYICYLEGNSNEMVILKDGKPQKENDKNPIFKLEGLTINQALQLASFEALKETAIVNLLSITDEKAEYEEYIAFYDLLCLKNGDKRTINSDLRKQCIESNKKGKTLISNDLPPSIKEELEKDKSGAFGKPFELMVAYKILEEIKKQSLTSNIAELAVSYNTKHSKDNINKDFTGNKNIDEFDIALLTKQGKFVIFECKSGSMSGDNAKSHKYSTYAVGGVYGMPILVVPLTSDEMSSKETLDTLSKDSEDVKYIIAAVNSAKRANLEVWGIDEIDKRLKDLLQIQ